MIFLGFSLGILNLVDLGIFGIGELIFTLILTYNGLIKKHDKINISKNRNIIYIFLLLIYFVLYFWFSNIDVDLIIKNFFKWFVILIQIISIYNCLRKNENNTMKFVLSYLLVSKFIECFITEIGPTLFMHYFVLIFLFVLLLRYIKKAKYEILLYIICLLYFIFADARIALVLFISFLGYKLASSFIKDLSTDTYSKKIKNILLIFIIFVFCAVGIIYVDSQISISTASNDERTQLINIAIEELKNNFLMGVGPGNFNNYAQENLGYYLRNDDLSPHNIYLEILSELGIVGFLLFINILLPFIKYLFSKNACIYTGYMVVYLIVYYLFSTFSGINRLLFAVFVACCMYYKEIDLKRKDEINAKR